MRNLIQALLDLLYPPRCLFCQGILDGSGSPAAALEPLSLDFESMDRILCKDCAETISWLAACCPVCAYPRRGEEQCSWCWGEQFAFESSCAVGNYSRQLRQSLHRFKYRGEKAMAGPFGELLSAKLARMPWIDQVDLIIPVPLCERRIKERGYNQAQLLAYGVSKKLSIPLDNRLNRVRKTQSQTSLNKNQRKENLAGAFICPEPLPPGCHVLLVDDVLTTGATAHEAAGALKEAGAGCVSIAVLAR